MSRHATYSYLTTDIEMCCRMSGPLTVDATCGACVCGVPPQRSTLWWGSASGATSARGESGEEATYSNWCKRYARNRDFGANNILI